MAKLQRLASQRRARRRAALALADLSGKSTGKVFVTKLPRRERGSQKSDWESIGKDFRVAIGKIDSAREISRGR